MPKRVSDKVRVRKLKSGDGRSRESRRARAREVDALVQEVAKAMVDGRWGPELCAEMAEREGVGFEAVEDYAKQAGRLMRIGPDVEAYRAINLRRLDRAHAIAADTKERVAAISEQNKMLGLHAPVQAKLSVDVNVVRPLEQMSAAELRAELVELDADAMAIEARRAAVTERLAQAEAITVPALPAKETENDEE